MSKGVCTEPSHTYAAPAFLLQSCVNCKSDVSPYNQVFFDIQMDVSCTKREGKSDDKVSDSFGGKAGFRALIVEWDVLNKKKECRGQSRRTRQE